MSDTINLKYYFNTIYNSLRINLKNKNIGSSPLSEDLTISILNNYSNSFRSYMKKVHNIDCVICKFTRKSYNNNYYAIYKSLQCYPLQYFYNTGDIFYWVYTKTKYRQQRKAYVTQRHKEAILHEFSTKFFKLKG